MATPRLKIVTDMVAHELAIYNATKPSGLVAIIATSFLNVEDQ